MKLRPMPRHLRCHLALLSALLFFSSAHATDFSGAWRLDDRHSDNADTLTLAMRAEAHKEQAARVSAASNAQGSNTGNKGNGNGGGHHGGGMGGGHGKHGGNNTDTSDSTANNDKDPIDSATYPMPPLLKIDSVLLVTQDAKTFQVRLDDGTQMNGKLDDVPRQSLNGNAMVRGHADANSLSVSIRYEDGSQLDQSWALSADGHQMVVTGAWKVGALEQPVSYTRSYVGL